MLRSMPQAERRKQGLHVAKRLAARIHAWGATRILAYLPMSHELPIDGLLDDWYEQGIEVFVPGSCIGDEQLTWWKWTPFVALQSDDFGIRVPKADSRLSWLEPDETFDVLLVPGVAFDRTGGRLGYGGGYYDRFLRASREKQSNNVDAHVKTYFVIGACLDIQDVESVPMQAFDQQIEWLITPTFDGACQNNRN